MKTLAFAGALLCALGLSACQTTGPAVVATGSTPIVINPATLPPIVAQAQAKVVAACGFLPTERTVIAIAKTFKPDTAATLDLVDQVSAGICAAANGGSYVSLKSKPRKPGRYRGVPVQGRFLAPPPAPPPAPR